MLRKIVALATAAVALAGPATAAELKLMTGPQGGIWVPLGGQLKDLWEKAVPGLSIQALPGAGIANAKAVEQGKSDIGFGNSITTADAINGVAPFEKPHSNICNIATLYPQYFQMVVTADSGIKSIKDLKGKALTTQPKGNTGEMITQQILKVNGLTYSDVKMSFVSYTDSVSQMKDNQAQMFTAGTGIPAGAIMDIAASRDVRLIDQSESLDGMKKLNAGYNLIEIPAGTYPKQDQPVKVIGYATHIFASCKLSDDTAYKMTKAIADNIPTISATAKATTGLTPAKMAESVGVPFHPGAAKFYKEKGIDAK